MRKYKVIITSVLCSLLLMLYVTPIYAAEATRNYIGESKLFDEQKLQKMLPGIVRVWSKYEQPIPELDNKVYNITWVSGTGFFIDEHHIITNHHVVQPSREIGTLEEVVIVRNDGRQEKVNIVTSDANRDIAVLYSEKPAEHYFRLAQSVTQTQEVAIIGYPGKGHKYYPTITEGIVYDLSYNITNAETLPGNSGSPLLNSAGEVVGVMYAFQVNLETGEYTGFAYFRPTIDVLVMMDEVKKLEAVQLKNSA